MGEKIQVHKTGLGDESDRKGCTLFFRQVIEQLLFETD
jgi:hypothetical protein